MAATALRAAAAAAAAALSAAAALLATAAAEPAASARPRPQLRRRPRRPRCAKRIEVPSAQPTERVVVVPNGWTVAKTEVQVDIAVIWPVEEVAASAPQEVTQGQATNVWEQRRASAKAFGRPRGKTSRL